MGLWDSIKKIGKTVANGVSGFFTGQPVFNTATNTISSGISGINWGQTLQNLLGTGLNLASQAIPYLYSEKASKDAIQANKEAQARQYRYNVHLMDWQNKYNMQQQQKQYGYNLQLQQQQQNWQEALSNTAHQREIADLKSAGLNPLLTAGGNGAGTPNGGMATVGMGSASGSGVGLTDDGQQIQAKVGNAIQFMNLKQQMKSINSQIAQRNAEIELMAKKQQTEQSQKELNDSIANINKIEGKYRSKKLESEIGKLVQEIGLINAQTSVNQKTIDLYQSEITKNIATANLYNSGIFKNRAETGLFTSRTAHENDLTKRDKYITSKILQGVVKSEDTGDNWSAGGSGKILGQQFSFNVGRGRKRAYTRY